MSKRPILIKRRPPHFDSIPTIEEIELLTSDPDQVARHAFYPFIEYEKRWTRFSRKNDKPKEKTRTIRYAARRDSCIFSHYRAILGEKYEAQLEKAGISHCVLGYRRIPKPQAQGNKCNIDFAKDAFEQISHAGNCHAYCLDISKFFDNLDHEYLKTAWANLLGSKSLPADHFHVYKAITRFSYLNKLKIYEVLGLIGKPPGISTKSKAFLVRREDIPPQLCSPGEFRVKLAPSLKLTKHLKVSHKALQYRMCLPISTSSNSIKTCTHGPLLRAVRISATQTTS